VNGYTPHQSTYLAYRITLEGRGEDAFAKSLSSARVETKPHQVDASLFALHSPLSRGVILADEVGLGKTIEASLVIAQRWAERRRRILLVVPASLRKQWQQELHEKFSLPSIILETKTFRDAEKGGQQRPFDCTDAIVITSYEFAARRAEDVRLTPWDLVIFDEAHRLRNVYKKSGSSRAKALRTALAERFKILLTATPLQNSLLELYGLVSVLDDRFFGDEATFKAMYAGARADAVSLRTLRSRIQPVYKRHLRRDVQQAGHVSFTRRMATTFDFESSDRETQLYELVSRYLQRPDSIAFGLRPNQLVIIQARKILGSSVVAIAGFLEKVIERLEKKQPADSSTVEDLDNTSEVGEELAEAATLEAGENDGNGVGGVEDGELPSLDPGKLASELAELRTYLALARSIGPNAKGEKLVARLPEVLDEIEKRGGARKAVIFTESVRTQNYLASLLAQNGYAGQIVLLNGSNSDRDSRELYRAWLDKHKGTDAVSGSRSADVKAAVVEGFRGDEKTILIATESGAEGINLQFCSVLVNFDLPWNPQRVEQRIGRCHRYGQKIDVTVVNMLNRRNKAEQRVYELLDQKFRLFSGVFGASDEVLGVIESGIDFERKVVEAVQRGRTDAEVEAEFQKIEEQLQLQINADMRDARRKLFDEFDRDVVALLRQRGEEITVTLDTFEQRLLTLAKAELPQARFHADNGRRFDYDGLTYTTEWPLADERNWQFFRLAEGTLARQIVDDARTRLNPPTSMRFDYGAFRAQGNARLSKVEKLIGRAGWLRVCLMTLASADPSFGNRERLVVAACFDGSGERVDHATIDDLFLLPTADLVRWNGEFPEARVTEIDAEARAEIIGDAERESRQWLDEETEKLDAYADDLEKAADVRIKELNDEARAAKKALRGNNAIPLDEKIKEERRIKALQAEADELKFTMFQRRRAIRAEVDQKLDAMAEALKVEPTVTPFLTLRWEVAQ
jgi:superfamily II DNA or RNA helicase